LKRKTARRISIGLWYVTGKRVEHPNRIKEGSYKNPKKSWPNLLKTHEAG
jgi:hypothetical protein